MTDRINMISGNVVTDIMTHSDNYHFQQTMNNHYNNNDNDNNNNNNNSHNNNHYLHRQNHYQNHHQHSHSMIAASSNITTVKDPKNATMIKMATGGDVSEMKVRLRELNRRAVIPTVKKKKIGIAKDAMADMKLRLHELNHSVKTGKIIVKNEECKKISGCDGNRYFERNDPVKVTEGFMSNSRAKEGMEGMKARLRELNRRATIDGIDGVVFDKGKDDGGGRRGYEIDGSNYNNHVVVRGHTYDDIGMNKTVFERDIRSPFLRTIEKRGNKGNKRIAVGCRGGEYYKHGNIGNRRNSDDSHGSWNGSNNHASDSDYDSDSDSDSNADFNSLPSAVSARRKQHHYHYQKNADECENHHDRRNFLRRYHPCSDGTIINAAKHDYRNNRDPYKEQQLEQWHVRPSLSKSIITMKRDNDGGSNDDGNVNKVIDEGNEYSAKIDHPLTKNFQQYPRQRTRNYESMAKVYASRATYRCENPNPRNVCCTCCGQDVYVPSSILGTGMTADTKDEDGDTSLTITTIMTTKVFFPCGHLGVCDLCFFGGGTSSQGQRVRPLPCKLSHSHNSLSHWKKCPLCGDEVRLILDRTGDESEAYRSWVGEVCVFVYDNKLFAMSSHALISHI